MLLKSKLFSILKYRGDKGQHLQTKLLPEQLGKFLMRTTFNF